MTRKRLIEDIKQAPMRFYRVPGDVLRDRRFGAAERGEILAAWRSLAPDPQIDAALAMLESRRHAAR